MKPDDLPATLRAALDGDPTRRADPLADDTIGRILALGEHDANTDAKADDAGGPDLDTIALLNAQIARWQLNGDLDGWRAGPELPPAMAAELEAYVAAARTLPDWADAAQIARAETLFMDIGMMSCTLLFCASLPQCYVIPDLAAVLHVAGQLERHTDYRVRSTAAMIFPVMMRGGLGAADGGGVAQALKVRLIHATIRHLILRGTPARALARQAPLPPLANDADPVQPNLHRTLYAQGWDVDRLGLPCNQEELAYTLLTFGYVFLAGLRRLGIGLPRADEEAYLHTWNVLGHLLGIERHLMPDTMDEAQALFEAIQARGRRQPQQPDPRPALGTALMRNLQRYIPIGLLKPFPVLLTRHLCGPAASKDLGLDRHVSLPARLAFALGLGVTRAFDKAMRLVWPDFSIARLVTRILGYRLTVELLMDQTRPLKLPTALLNQVGNAVRAWHNDPKAPRWMNALERRITGRAPDAKG